MHPSDPLFANIAFCPRPTRPPLEFKQFPYFKVREPRSWDRAYQRRQKHGFGWKMVRDSMLVPEMNFGKLKAHRG